MGGSVSNLGVVASGLGGRSAPPDDESIARRWFLAEWLFVLLSFAVFASLRSPIPGVNEPHYLTKSRHFWDPAWCSRDPFLQSANAHYVFYATVGALTQFLTLAQTAAAGRVLGWGLLAAGWCTLARQLIPVRWGALWSAWIFLCFAAIGNWSGEWVVGGIEAKVLSYGCAWLSVAAALAGNSLRSAAWAGAAVSFHPVVGVWNSLALLAACQLDDWRIWRLVARDRWQAIAGHVVMWTACAAPGLVPAIAMLRGANRNQSYAADYIQVFYRLAHHLDPWKFSSSGYACYTLLLVLSVVLYRWLARPSARWSIVFRYVAMAVLIAVGGIAIRAVPDVALSLQGTNLLPAAHEWLESWVRYKPHLAGLLKFYPFRLADLIVPWAASLLLTLGIVRVSGRWPTGWGICGLCFVVALLLPAVDRQPGRFSAERFAEWVDASRWVERETPQDALCFAGNEGWALKWYASRAEYLSQKDCPQDAPGIIAWNARFRFISMWSARHLQHGYSRAAIRELRQHTKIDYVIASNLGPFEIEPRYRNGHYQVYCLSDAD